MIPNPAPQPKQTLGLIADIHGDLPRLQQALAFFDHHQITTIYCAGDIVDRGPHADQITTILQQRHIPTIRGNHEYTITQNQDRYRQKAGQSEAIRQRLTAKGRLVNDHTLDFIRHLPPTLSWQFAGYRFLMAHGTPWSDILGLFPDSRPSRFHQIHDRYAHTHDIIILGHTHTPLHATINNLHIINPGAICGFTIRDSHICAYLTLPNPTLHLHNLNTNHTTILPSITIPTTPAQPTTPP
ncbi:MAG TPA: metallophosphoesterase family protein [Anaerolineae bacterium]|nr:metallophosphoesterase family protein [Anaerolineae bacterium]